MLHSVTLHLSLHCLLKYLFQYISVCNWRRVQFFVFDSNQMCKILLVIILLLQLPKRNIRTSELPAINDFPLGVV